MKIGIDLDNTIISYNEAFLSIAKKQRFIDKNIYGSKQEIKEIIQNNHKGEIIWQKLQGLVYGKYIDEAKIYQGFKRFVWRCYFQNISVYVISHKTEFGHQDKENIPLRKAALNFLKSNELITDIDGRFFKEIHFTSTREEKIDKINEYQFDWFIDDLQEVICHKNINHTTNKILFSNTKNMLSNNSISLSSWEQIEKRILGPLSNDEIKEICIENLTEKVSCVEWVGGRGNSGVYKVIFSDQDKKKLALKIYSYKKNNSTLFAEFEGTKKMVEENIKNVAMPVVSNMEFSLAYYEWIDGCHILKPNNENLDDAITFLKRLHSLRDKKKFSDFPRASAACFSGLDIELQLKERISNLRKARYKSQELNLYLTNELEPFVKIAIDWSRKNWEKIGDFDRELSKKDLTLSPSDFGFHNSLIRDNGEIAFHDFEYFGWDDPVKLIVDFSLHPGMNLDQKILDKWFRGTKNIYGENTISRLKAAWPLYALCWALIYLNEYLDNVWERRILADPGKIEERETILENQLKLSKELLMLIKNNYKENKIIGNF
ncbi:MAG: hypothetical protein H8E74_03635 [Gammaproteobacteria bacterium]|nr:hypothetical protein [Gammaproteobacteria bacterium]